MGERGSFATMGSFCYHGLLCQHGLLVPPLPLGRYSQHVSMVFCCATMGYLLHVYMYVTTDICVFIRSSVIRSAKGALTCMCE